VGLGFEGNDDMDCEGKGRANGLTGLNHLNELKNNVLNDLACWMLPNEL